MQGGITDQAQTTDTTNVLAVPATPSNGQVAGNPFIGVPSSVQVDSPVAQSTVQDLIPASPANPPSSPGAIESQPALSFAGINVNPITNQDPQLMVKEA